MWISSPSLRSALQQRRRLSGMTILELAVVVVIIFILTSMLLPAFSRLRARANEATCVANLKNLYVGASGYIQTNSSWPQIPNTLVAKDPVKYAKTWVAALAPFGISHLTWICPTVQSEAGQPMSSIENDEGYRVDYVGMAFDDNPISPYPEKAFPWFVEMSGFHGRGNLLILSNGNVKSLADMVR